MSPSEQTLSLRHATTESDLAAAMEVRQRVFVEEQHVPPEEEVDSLDAMAAHVVVEANGTVVATGRLTNETGEARIGRIAVLQEWRRHGIAGQIIGALETEARKQGHRQVALHAQTYVQGLYDKHGYVVSGASFIEAGIDHVPMTKQL